MLSLLSRPWPWYVAGPLIGLFVPFLLLVGNRSFGMSACLRALCAALWPGKVEFLRYDWKQATGWNVALAAGLMMGACFAVNVLGVMPPSITAETRAAIANLGLAYNPTGLVPAELFSWKALLTLRGDVCIIGGGFLIGFGAAYGGGCTSGHGVTGLASLQVPSVIALLGIFAGGLSATFVLIPLLF
jgi:uncharacterized protein